MQATVKWTGDLGFDCAMDTGETCHLDGKKHDRTLQDAIVK
jgi:hypothetical protein